MSGNKKKNKKNQQKNKNKNNAKPTQVGKKKHK